MEDGSAKIGEKPEPRRILIVDDEETALKRMQRLMENRGYETHTATKGKQALDLLKALSFDLVLTDLVLDSIDGLAILSYTKKMSPDTEVVIVTGYASVDSAIQATKKGAFHYLQKPIRPDELFHIVEQALLKRGLKTRVRELEQGGQTDFSNIMGDQRFFYKR